MCIAPGAHPPLRYEENTMIEL